MIYKIMRPSKKVIQGGGYSCRGYARSIGTRHGRSRLHVGYEQTKAERTGCD